MLKTFLELEEIVESLQETIKLQQETIKRLSLENLNLKQILNETMKHQ